MRESDTKHRSDLDNPERKLPSRDEQPKRSIDEPVTDRLDRERDRSGRFEEIEEEE